MEYYTRAKEFIIKLLDRIRGRVRGGTSSFKLGERFRRGFSSSKLGDRFRGGFSSSKLGERLKGRLSSLKSGEGFNREEWQRHWKDGVARLSRGFNRQNIAQLKSFQAIKNFDYENFFDQVFSPQSYRIVHRGFLGILFVVVTYGMGKILSYVLLPGDKPVVYKANAGMERLFMSSGKKTEEWGNIITADLFRTGVGGDNAAGKTEKKKAVVNLNVTCDDSSKISSLPFKLINAVVLQNRKKSVASVRQEGKKKMLYLREGDSVENISVKKISWPKMVFVNHRSGECEHIIGKTSDGNSLWRTAKPTILSPEKGRKLIEGKKNEDVIKVGNTFQIKKELKEEILDNINTILTQAKAVEIKNPDGVTMF